MSCTIPTVGHVRGHASRRTLSGIAAAGLVLAGASVTGCSVVRAVNHVRQTVEGNKAVITAFTSGLKSSEATPFEATYVTTGSSPTKVVYAVQPPKDASFRESAAGGVGGTGNLDLVSNSSGEYSCAQASGSSSWSCQKLGKAQATAQNQIVGLYTPRHWVAFLEGFSIAAGFAGDKVTKSTMTVNGFAMSCVDFRASGVQGVSTICTTAQNILGYVKVASNPTSFELKSYTATPSASLFQLPGGAKITNGG
jgi:hypothetical protein